MDHVARRAAVANHARTCTGERVDRRGIGRVTHRDRSAEHTRRDRQRLLRTGRHDHALAIDARATLREPAGDPAPQLLGALGPAVLQRAFARGGDLRERSRELCAGQQLVGRQPTGEPDHVVARRGFLLQHDDARVHHPTVFTSSAMRASAAACAGGTTAT